MSFLSDFDNLPFLAYFCLKSVLAYKNYFLEKLNTKGIGWLANAFKGKSITVIIIVGAHKSKVSIWRIHISSYKYRVIENASSSIYIYIEFLLYQSIPWLYLGGWGQMT